MPALARFRPARVGAGFERVGVEAVAGLPSVGSEWGGIDLSPDGSEVAFAWDRTGSSEIYTVPIAGDRIIQLTEGGRRSVSPSWSPDGSPVTVLRDRAGTARFAILGVDS